MDKQIALIVEDDLSSSRLYQRLLGAAGYDHQLCETYDTAIAFLKENTPQLLLLDMRLENIDAGPGILEYVRASARLKDMRVVIITAYSTMIEKYGHLADMVVLKPVNARELMVYVEEGQDKA